MMWDQMDFGLITAIQKKLHILNLRKEPPDGGMIRGRQEHDDVCLSAEDVSDGNMLVDRNLERDFNSKKIIRRSIRHFLGEAPYKGDNTVRINEKKPTDRT